MNKENYSQATSSAEDKKIDTEFDAAWKKMGTYSTERERAWDRTTVN